MKWINAPSPVAPAPSFIHVKPTIPQTGKAWDLSQSFAAAALGASTFAVANRTVNYFANRFVPNVALGPDELIRLYHGGSLKWDDLCKCLEIHGISCEPSSAINIAADQWKRIIQLARSKPSDSTVLDLYLRDRISDVEADARLKELGYSSKRERDLLLALDNQHGLPLILSLYHRDKIKRDEAVTWLRRLGYLNAADNKFLLDMENPLNGGDVLALYLRGHLSESEADEHLKRNGYRVEHERRLILSLSQVIPPLTDIVRFVKRDTFDEELVQQFGLDDEYELQRERYEFWANAQGLGEMTLPGSPNGESINWPQMYYRADWQYISPTQAYEALHRFRPNRVHLYRPIVPGIRPFGLSDMFAILKAADYPKSMRDWLVGSSYNLLTLTDIKNFYASGALGSVVLDGPINTGDVTADATNSPAKREAYELYQDRGYKPIDAARLTLDLANRHAAKNRRLTFGQARAVIADGYRVGILSWEEAAVRLYRLRFESAEQRTTFDALPFAEKVAVARADADTMQALAHIDFQADLQLVKERIRYIRAGYFSGRWDRNEAGLQLTRLGIDDTKAEKYLDTWDAKRTFSRKALTVAQLVKYARYGIISTANLESRLKRFGYSDGDIGYIAGNLDRDIGLDRARILERAARTEQQRIRALEQQARRLEQERRRVARQMGKLGTASQMSTWVERGIMTPETMLRRLIALGISSEDAEAKVKEALQKRAERLARLQRSASGG